MFGSGLNELVVGKNAARAYQGFDLGGKVKFGGGDWTVVGIMDAGGNAFDSEAWCDAAVLNQVYKRPTNIFQAVTVRLTGPDAFPAFKDALTKDPRLDVTVDRELEYYATQSQMLTGLIQTLGFFIAFIMGSEPSSQP
jgi:putative ABC transport system permease protein